MPQMSSMDWLLLMIYFLFIFYLFMVFIYFLMEVEFNKFSFDSDLHKFEFKWY